MFEESLVTFIKSKTEITNLISNKFYPVTIPEKINLPAGTYELVSADHKSNISGNYGIVSKIYSLYAYANTYAEVKNILSSYKTVLKNYSGTFGEIELQLCLIAGESEVYKDNEFYGFVDFEFYFNE